MKQTILLTLISLGLFSCVNNKQETIHNSEGEWLVNRSGQIELYTRKPDFKSNSILNTDIQKELEKINLSTLAFTSPNEEDINRILKNQNNYIQQINKFLGTDFKDTVKIFLYNFDEYHNWDKKYANDITNTIYYVFYNFLHDEDGQINTFIGPHEMVHVVSYNTLGRAKTRLFGEGYAVAITKDYSSEIINGKVFLKSLESWQESIKKSSGFLSPLDLLDNESLSEMEFYPQAGIFIDWLFKQYDTLLINKLFLLDKMGIIEEFETITGDSFNKMEQEYMNYITH